MGHARSLRCSWPYGPGVEAGGAGWKGARLSMCQGRVGGLKLCPGLWLDEALCHSKPAFK